MERTRRRGPPARRLVQGDVRPRSVTESVRRKHEVDPFGRVHEVERPRVTEPAGADGSGASLELAAPSHIKFVNNQTAIHVRHPDTQCEVRLTKPKMAEQCAPFRPATVNQVEFARDQPAGPGSLVV